MIKLYIKQCLALVHHIKMFLGLNFPVKCQPLLQKRPLHVLLKVQKTCLLDYLAVGVEKRKIKKLKFIE